MPHSSFFVFSLSIGSKTLFPVYRRIGTRVQKRTRFVIIVSVVLVYVKQVLLLD